MKIVLVIILLIIPLEITVGIKLKEEPKQEQREELIIRSDYEMFCDYFAFRESSNNPDTINELGYIGLYQFGRSALKTIGFGHISIEEFKIKRSKIFPIEEQRKAFDALIKFNSFVLKDYIERYDGKVIRGYKVNKAALLGAAHISGAGGVITWIKTGYNPKDIFGTKLTDYLLEFSRFNI